MENVYDDMRAAVRDAKETLKAADHAADAMAEILRGRLRHVSPWTLSVLKRELRDYDMQKRQWKP